MKYIITVLVFVALLSCSKQEEVQKEATQEEQVQENAMTKAEALELGNEISAETQAVLLQNVSFAMQSKGKEFAVEFCNMRANPITDSLSALYNASISRISEKNRNPNNAPKTENDLSQLKEFESRTGDDKKQSVVIDEDGNLVFYKPIYAGMEACMVCHGTIGNELEKSFHDKILEKYPDDKANGYKLGDFRGAWKIVFNKKI